MENSYWLKNLNAQIRGQLPLGMIQQASLNGIILRPKPQPESHRIESVVLQPQATTTTTTTSTTTPPPGFAVTLVNGEGGALTFFDVDSTSTSITITGVTPGVYTILAEALAGFTFNGWTVSGGAVVDDPFNPSTNVTVSGDCTIQSVFVEDP